MFFCFGAGSSFPATHIRNSSFALTEHPNALLAAFQKLNWRTLKQDREHLSSVLSPSEAERKRSGHDHQSSVLV